MTVNGRPYREWLASSPPDPSFEWARCKCGAPIRADGAACTGSPSHATPAPTVRYYATLTGTRANLAAMHKAGMRVIVGPDQLDRARRSPPLSWALDNGAWGCFQRGVPFDGGAFREALARWGEGADFIVCPDIVGAGLDSLAFSVSWADEVRQAARRPVYLAVQDGMTEATVAPVLEWFDGLFIGGSTEWKEATMHAWGRYAAGCSLPMHVGRVNTDRRLRMAIDAGASSVDGTSPTRFQVNTGRLANVSLEPKHPALFPTWPGRPL